MALVPGKQNKLKLKLHPGSSGFLPPILQFILLSSVFQSEKIPILFEFLGFRPLKLLCLLVLSGFLTPKLKCLLGTSCPLLQEHPFLILFSTLLRNKLLFFFGPSVQHPNKLPFVIRTYAMIPYKLAYLHLPSMFLPQTNSFRLGPSWFNSLKLPSLPELLGFLRIQLLCLFGLSGFLRRKLPFNSGYPAPFSKNFYSSF
ncbi:hypothetical protein AVEN_268060-1 [Araneus ventricosus]|uniref:Uncharacterized protein n=1 Tax=Araneus ventricosus TaxID=182803 RepID=A0A4Y2KMQ9_ARAVE|nr:hypothetical protein AVEN_268060-1 [Araneus ventricosus]